MFQRIHLFKDGGVTTKRGRGIETARAAATGLFTVACMRSGVGAEERAAESAGDQFTQRLLVDIALEDRQAI